MIKRRRNDPQSISCSSIGNVHPIDVRDCGNSLGDDVMKKKHLKKELKQAHKVYDELCDQFIEVVREREDFRVKLNKKNSEYDELKDACVKLTVERDNMKAERDHFESKSNLLIEREIDDKGPGVSDVERFYKTIDETS